MYIILQLLCGVDSFTTWILQGLSRKQGKTRLSQISDLIDWTPIRRRLDEMYHNKGEKGGRPNCDVQNSDMSFLGFPNPSPDSRTIWLFKERMAETGMDEVIWAELQRQLDAMGLQVKRGTIQDVTFIEADHGSSKKPRGNEAMTRRSRDGTWAKKGDETHFG